MQQLVGQHVQEWRCGCAQYPRYPVPSTWYLVPGTQYLVPQLQRGRLYNPQLIPSIAANRIEATQPKDGQPNIGTIPGSLLSVVRDLGRNCLASAMPGALRPLMPRPVPVAPVFLTTAGCRDMLHACSGRDGAAAFAEIKAAPSVAAVLSLTFENFAQKPGGPVFALFQLESEDGRCDHELHLQPGQPSKSVFAEQSRGVPGP
jgi:hypothetical protein